MLKLTRSAHSSIAETSSLPLVMSLCRSVPRRVGGPAKSKLQNETSSEKRQLTWHLEVEAGVDGFGGRVGAGPVGDEKAVELEVLSKDFPQEVRALRNVYAAVQREISRETSLAQREGTHLTRL